LDLSIEGVFPLQPWIKFKKRTQKVAQYYTIWVLDLDSSLQIVFSFSIVSQLFHRHLFFFVFKSGQEISMEVAPLLRIYLTFNVVVLYGTSDRWSFREEQKLK
jgi:hypothetical protein